MLRKKTVTGSTRIVFIYILFGICWNLFFVLLLNLLIKNKSLHSLLVIGEIWVFIGFSALVLHRFIQRKSLSLRETEELFQSTFEQAAVGIAHVAINGNWLRVNRKLCDILGYSAEELMSLTFQDITHPEDLDSDLMYVNKVLANEIETYSMDKRYVRKDRSLAWIHLTVSLVRDSEGVPKFFISVIEDISIRKESENELNRYKEHLEELVEERSGELSAAVERLKEAQQIAHVGHWELNFETDKLTWSDEVYNIYEVDHDQFEASFDPFFNLLSPMEKEKVSRMYSESVLNDTPYDIVNKFNFPGGRVKYIHESTQNFYDQSGKLVRLVGTIQDITSRWVTEEKLRQLSRVVEQSPVCVVITDLDGCITYVNPKFSELTGYGFDEVLGQNSRILKSGVTPQETYELLWEAILSGEEWRGEFCNRKKNGELYWEMAYIAPVVNTQGETTHYVAVKEDITARKKAEEQLRELSLSDELTGLTNRRGFMLLAKQQIKVSDRSRKGLVLIFADLDDMKSINDTYGHHEGDQALKDTSAILRRSLRASDVIARLGGDEFVALSVDASDKVEELIMGRLRENILAHNLESGRPYELSISFGITIYNPVHPCTLEELLSRGDRLMYDQKKNRIGQKK